MNRYTLDYDKALISPVWDDTPYLIPVFDRENNHAIVGFGIANYEAEVICNALNIADFAEKVIKDKENNPYK